MELPPPDDPDFEMGGTGLHGTMNDYRKFIYKILNDGELDGVRVLQPETVATICENHIGDLRVKKFVTVAPLHTNEAEFFPGQRQSWGLVFQTPKRSPTPAGLRYFNMGRARQQFFLARQDQWSWWCLR